MSKSINYEDLLDGSRLRTKEVPIDGLGNVTLHEISAAEQWECTSAVQAAEGEELDKVVFAWAGRFLKGSMPDEAEVEKLQQHLGTAVLGQIYHEGLNFNAAGPKPMEDATKNSESNPS